MFKKKKFCFLIFFFLPSPRFVLDILWTKPLVCLSVAGYEYDGAYHPDYTCHICEKTFNHPESFSSHKETNHFNSSCCPFFFTLNNSKNVLITSVLDSNRSDPVVSNSSQPGSVWSRRWLRLAPWNFEPKFKKLRSWRIPVQIKLYEYWTNYLHFISKLTCNLGKSCSTTCYRNLIFL